MIKKSNKLNNVLYDIRGPVLKEAEIMKEEGHQIIQLNIGNPSPFGFDAPDEITQDIVHNIHNAQGYCDSKGIFPARKAIMQYYQNKGVIGVELDDIIIGNGASELITLSLQALLNNGDEVLIPAPDYPLWTAATNLAGGTAIHYVCDEKSSWYPDINDIKGKITSNTKAIVVINPNNPTGAVYPEEILKEIIKIAQENNIIIFSDEIYEKIIYDNLPYKSMASLADDILIITLNGLSKAYRSAGFRCGWMLISGNKARAEDYIEGITLLSSMRLCSNVPAQYAVQTALGGYQSINELITNNGRLLQQRNYLYKELNKIDGISCVKPNGALYMFPKIDTKKFNIKSDEKFILDLLKEEKILAVHGTGFNWIKNDHFRIVFLPEIKTLEKVIKKLKRFLSHYNQEL